ncbi:MAG TPA: MqnA/MqnD/SBP family protein, partial [Dissulfurispiraceae bacterium]|nr:MqnA/MqnD/SBP family protein [Dissulfurispiraceae bacterium]
MDDLPWKFHLFLKSTILYPVATSEYDESVWCLVVNIQCLVVKFSTMIRLGFSPCPNDTFIFFALANKLIDTHGLDFTLHIEDVETLNRLAVGKALEVSKVSCHAFRYLQDDYHFLSTGGALGRGCGPLVIAKDLNTFCSKKPIRDLKIAIPGKLTTA